jgi:hypothetical protein
MNASTRARVFNFSSLQFSEHDCQTCRYAKLAGLKNGRLLDAAESAGFDVLITADQNIPDQQNLVGRGIVLVILRGATNRLHDLELLVPAALLALDSNAPGRIVRIRQTPEQGMDTARIITACEAFAERECV